MGMHNVLTELEYCVCLVASYTACDSVLLLYTQRVSSNSYVVYNQILVILLCAMC